MMPYILFQHHAWNQWLPISPSKSSLISWILLFLLHLMPILYQQWMPRLHVHQFVQVYSDIIRFCWIEKQIQSLVLSSPPWDIQLPKGFTEVGHLLIGRPAPAYSYCTPKQIWLLPKGFGRPWVWVPHTLLILKYSKFVCRWCYPELFLLRKKVHWQLNTYFSKLLPIY